MSISQIPAINHINMEIGKLGTIDFSTIPFIPKRFYWLSETEGGQVRGQHAHKRLSQCIFLASGSCELRVQDESSMKVFQLTADSQLVYLKPGLWRELHNFTEGTVVCVLADEVYQEEDYIRNFDDYLEWVKSGQ